MTKTCPRCGLDLPRTAFGWRDREHTKIQSYCKACMNISWREWYQKPENKRHHLRLVGKRRKRRIARLRALVRDTKSQPCVDCGGTFPPEAMDFDHVRGEKVLEISAVVHQLGEDALRREMRKCDVVCANCHRIRTARRAQHPGEAG